MTRPPSPATTHAWSARSGQRSVRLAVLLSLTLILGSVPLLPGAVVVAAPVVLDVVDVVGGEAAGGQSVVFARSKDLVDEAMSFPVQIESGKGATGNGAIVPDDVSTTQTTLDFALGSELAALTVAVSDDGLFEGSEYYAIAVGLPEGIATFEVDIADSATPKIDLAVGSSLLTEGDIASVTIVSDTAPVNTVALTLRAAAGTAGIGTDVVELDELVELAAGTTSATGYKVATIDDDVADAYEERFMLGVHLGAPADVPATAVPVASRTMRILDNEPYFGFTRTPDTVGESVHRISVDEPATGTVDVVVPLDVRYDTYPYGFIAGEIFVEQLPLADTGSEAVMGVDFEVSRASIDNTTTTPTLTVTVLADAFDEIGGEVARLGLRHDLFCDCGWSQRVDDVIEISIGEGVAPPEPFTFSAQVVDGGPVSEASGTARLTVRRDAPPSAAAQLRVVTVAGTAAAALDFTPVDRTVTLDATPFQSVGIDIGIIDDPVVDDRQLETFTVQVFHLDSGAPDAATVPVLEQQITIEDDEAMFAFQPDVVTVARPEIGPQIIELPIRSLYTAWPLLGDFDEPLPLTLAASFADPGTAAAAGVRLLTSSVVVNAGAPLPVVLVEVAPSALTDPASLTIQLERTPRLSGPLDGWPDAAADLVVLPPVPPSSSVGDDLRAAIAAVYDSAGALAGGFTLDGSNGALPVLGSDLNAMLELSPAAELLARLALDEAADDIDALLADFEANGCSVDFVAGGIGGRTPAAPGDVVQTTCAVAASSVSPTGASPLDDAVSDVYQWLIDQPRTFGNLDVAGQLGASITVGVDAQGPYVAGSTGLRLELSADGTLLTTSDGVAVASASGTAQVDLTVGLDVDLDTNRRVRLAELADAVEAGGAPRVDGTARFTAQSSNQVLRLRGEYDATISTTPSGAFDLQATTTFTGAVTVDLPRSVTVDDPTPAPNRVEIPIVATLEPQGGLRIVGELVDQADLIVDGFAVTEMRVDGRITPGGFTDVDAVMRVQINTGGFAATEVDLAIHIESSGGVNGRVSITEDTADFGIIRLDQPTYSIEFDTKPEPGEPVWTIGIAAEALFSSVGETTVIEATGVTGTLHSSLDFELTIDEGVLGGEDSAFRFDIGGLTIQSPDANGIIVRADVITTALPLLGDTTTATVRGLVVDRSFRIGAASVAIERGPYSAQPAQILGMIPISIADLELEFTARDAAGFITDLEQFQVTVEAFVADDAFDGYPFGIVLQLGGEIIRRDTPSVDRRIGFTAAVDSVTPLVVRPIELGPISLGIEGLGAPAPDTADTTFVSDSDGNLAFATEPRTPHPGFGFVVDALVTIDGYQDGVLQPGVSGFVNTTYNDGLLPERELSFIGDVVVDETGAVGLDLQLGLLVDVDLRVPQAAPGGDPDDPPVMVGPYIDDLEFVLSVEFGAAVTNPDVTTGIALEFLGARAASIDIPFGKLFDISVTDIDLDLSAETVFGADDTAALLTIGGSLAEAGSGAQLVVGEGFGPLAGWGGVAGQFALTRAGKLVPLDGFFAGLLTPEPKPGDGTFGLPDWVPLYVDEVAVEFGDLSLDQIPALTELTPALLDGIKIRVSGGLRSNPLFPISASVDGLVVDIGKLAVYDPATGFGDTFPIENLSALTFGIDPTVDFGGFAVGGALTFGEARVPTAGAGGGAGAGASESVLYGRIKGYGESPVISGGVDLVVSQYGPVLLKVTAPAGIPIGPTGFVLTDVTGAASFGDVAIEVPPLGDPVQLLSALDGNLPTDVDLTPAAIVDAITPAVQAGVPTWNDGFAIAVAGRLTNVAAGGLAGGDVTLAITVGTPMPGGLAPGLQAIGFGTLEVFGIPLTDDIELVGDVARAGIMIDLTDVTAPRIDLAFQTPTPGSPVGLIFPASAVVAAQLDLTGLPTGVRAGLRSLIDQAGPAMGRIVDEFVAVNTASEFATLYRESGRGASGERLLRLLDERPEVVVPALLSLIRGNIGGVVDGLGVVRTAARDALLAADAEFDPSFVFEGVLQPQLLGLPIGEPETEIKVTMDKDNISFGATGSLIEALKDQAGIYTLSGELAGGLFALATLGATDRLTFDVQIPVPDLRSVLLDGGRLDALDPASTSTQFAVQVEGDLIVAGSTMSVGGVFTAPNNATFLDTLVQKRFELPADAPVINDRVQILRAVDYDNLIERGGLLLYGRLQVPRIVTDPVDVLADLPPFPADALGVLQWFDDSSAVVTATEEPISATLFVPGLPTFGTSATANDVAIRGWMQAVSLTGVFDGTARTPRAPRTARLLSLPIGQGAMVATAAGLEITANIPLLGTTGTFVTRIERRAGTDRGGKPITVGVPMVSLETETTAQAAMDAALDTLGLPSVWQPSRSAGMGLRAFSPGFDLASADRLRRSGGVALTAAVDLPPLVVGARGEFVLTPSTLTTFSAPDWSASFDVTSVAVPGLSFSSVELDLAKQGAGISGAMRGSVDLALPGVVTPPVPFDAAFEISGDLSFSYARTVSVLGSSLALDLDVDVVDGRLSVDGTATGQLSVGALDLASGTLDVSVANGLLELRVPTSDPLSVDVFNVAQADVSGVVRSNGTYALNGSFATRGAFAGVSWDGDVAVALLSGNVVTGTFDGRVSSAGLSAQLTASVVRLSTGQGLVSGTLRVDLDGDGDFDGAYVPIVPEQLPFSFVIGQFQPPDIQRPVFGAVPDITVTVSDVAAEVPVEFAAPVAIDDRDGPITSTCTPGSGLIVSGSNPDITVTCTATDAGGNIATTTFEIRIDVEAIETASNVPPGLNTTINVSVSAPANARRGTGRTSSGGGWVFSTPQDLGTYTVAADGSVEFSAALPTLEPGRHHIVLTSLGLGGVTTMIIVPLVIDADGRLVELDGQPVALASDPAAPAPSPNDRLPVTGGGVRSLLLAAALLLLIGVGVWSAGRRARPAVVTGRREFVAVSADGSDRLARFGYRLGGVSTWRDGAGQPPRWRRDRTRR